MFFPALLAVDEMKGRRSLSGTSTHHSRASGARSLLCSVIHSLCTQPKITWRLLAGLLQRNGCDDLLPIVISQEFSSHLLVSPNVGFC